MGAIRASSKSRLTDTMASVGSPPMRPLTRVSLLTTFALVAACQSQLGPTSAPTSSSPSASPVRSVATPSVLSPTATLGAATPRATLRPTIMPSATSSRSPSLPTPSPSLQPQPTLVPPIEAPPPIPQLVTAGGVHVIGEQGSWCLDDECADIVASPIDDLPELRLAAAGDGIIMSVPQNVFFVYWRASYTDGEGEPYPPIVLGEGGTRIEPDQPTPDPIVYFSSAGFPGPPSGSWRLDIQLSFAVPLGDAHYKWHLVVP